ncbi:hypothetical protein LIER_41270 [Lithospermum erythrorhizon]|uniref:DUF4283 domain-containing protein n=1 Tax=Lithospermum erythrorhizon TaxID=34254 RepID=A0AAV3R9R0_LITER
MKHVLVGKFSHGRPAIAVVKEFFIGLILKGFPMRIFKWSPEFDPNKESPISLVWIHLPALPLYLFNEEALYSISNSIGKPLSIDYNNVKRINLGSTTVCMELDVSNPRMNETWVSLVDEESQVEVEASKSESIGPQAPHKPQTLPRLVPPKFRRRHVPKGNKEWVQRVFNNPPKQPAYLNNPPIEVVNIFAILQKILEVDPVVHRNDLVPSFSNIVGPSSLAPPSLLQGGVTKPSW